MKKVTIILPNQCWPASKMKFRQASNHCKRVLEAIKLAYSNEIKEAIAFQKHGSCEFWQISNSAFIKCKSSIAPLVNGTQVLPSAFSKAKQLTKNVLMT